jgi:hypothetical protein
VRSPRAPQSLSAAGRRFWCGVVTVYELSPGEFEMLAQAARVVDLLARIDVELLDEPLTVTGSTGQPRANPLLASSAEQRRTLAGLMRDLGLPMPDELVARRRSPSATAAAQQRWRERRAQHG